MEDDSYWSFLRRLCTRSKPPMQASRGSGLPPPVGSDDWFQENRPGQFRKYKPGEEELKSYIYGNPDQQRRRDEDA